MSVISATDWRRAEAARRRHDRDAITVMTNDELAAEAASTAAFQRRAGGGSHLAAVRIRAVGNEAWRRHLAHPEWVPAAVDGADFTIWVTRQEAAQGLIRYARSLGRGTPACGEAERRALEILRTADPDPGPPVIPLSSEPRQPDGAGVTDVPDGLPPAAQLIAEVRRVLAEGYLCDADAELNRYAPQIDAYADAATAAGWLTASGFRITPDSIYRERLRTRSGGEPGWPAPDLTAGRSGLWTFRTIVLHRASMPGRGTPGRPRPARRREAGDADR